MAVLSSPLLSLSTFPLFEGLTPDQVARLTQIFHPIIVTAATNIITMGQPGSVAYLVLAGTLKVHVEQADGSDVILAILGPGDLFGEMSLVEGCPYSATVFTLEECALYWVEHTRFEACLQTMPALAYNLTCILSRRLRLAGAHIQALAALDVFGRVARQLLAFAQEYGEPVGDGAIRIPLRLTQSDLAEMVGASRVHVNRVLCFYKQQRYLTVCADGRIIVHNPAALAQRCNKSYTQNET